MLERFKVPKEDQVRVPHDSLQETVTAVFEKMGVEPDDAALGADVLVSTDLRGVETHGVSNMLRSYVQQYNEGSLNPRPNWHFESLLPYSLSSAGVNRCPGKRGRIRIADILVIARR